MTKSKTQRRENNDFIQIFCDDLDLLLKYNFDLKLKRWNFGSFNMFIYCRKPPKRYIITKFPPNVVSHYRDPQFKWVKRTYMCTIWIKTYANLTSVTL